MRFFPQACLYLSLAAATPAFALAPEEFRLRLPLETSGVATWYRTTLGMEILFAASRSDLGDLRVFDGAGNALPYTVNLGTSHETEAVRETELRRFPLQGGAEESNPAPGVRVQTGSGGTLIEINPDKNRQPPGQIRRGWLLDASTVNGSMQRLDLRWQEGDGFQSFDIQTSDDLRHWSTCCEGQLARMAFDGQMIEQNSIPLPNLRARYLRLLWSEPKQAPLLTSIRAAAVQRETQGPVTVWSEPLPAASGSKDEWEWNFPVALPLERLRLEWLPPNTVAPVQVLGKYDDKRGWFSLAQGLIYQLNVQGKERTRQEIGLYATPIRRLKLKIDSRGGGLGPTAPRISVGATANELLFLARGNPPYTLAVGHENLTSNALPLSTLVPGGVTSNSAAIGTATVNAAVKTGPSTAQPKGAGASLSENFDWKRAALWAVLLLGVGLLGLMAWQLVKKPREPAG